MTSLWETSFGVIELAALHSGKGPRQMQWIIQHWFELASTALLSVVAINTLDRKWNKSTIVEQLNDIIRTFSSLARQDTASRRDSAR